MCFTLCTIPFPVLFFFFLLLSLYSIHHILIIIGWIRIPNHTQKKSKSNTYASIIIAFRNEKNNIAGVIEDIIEQDYDKSMFEIILVNDHSTDDSLKIIANTVNATIQYKTLTLPDEKQGKKHALDHGIQNATGELILTLDSDCRLPKEWLPSMMAFYEDKKPAFFFGPVIIHQSKTLLNAFQVIELANLIAAGAGATGIHQPILCNGANLAFQKSVYLQYKDPFNVKYVSGDDMFLMLNIKRNYRKKILFCKNIQATVITTAEQTLKKYIQQRKRWISKSAGYKDPIVIFSGLVMYITSIFILGSFIYSIFLPQFILYAVLGFGIKTCFDVFLFIFASGFFKTIKYLPLILPFQIFYIINVSVLPSLLFINKGNWKNRKI